MRKNAIIDNNQFNNLINQFYSYFETGYAFEEFLKIFLEKIGLDEVTITQRSRDGGVDLTAKRAGVGGFSEADEVEYYIQAKRNKPGKPIPVTKIRELKGTLPFGYKGIFITTTSFSADAIKESNNDISKPVILIDGKSLIESCIEHEIGFLFIPKFSKIEMDRLTRDGRTVRQETNVQTIEVEKQITANDIRAQILRIPKAIIQLVPTEANEYEVTFNGTTKKLLSIDKHRVYFAKVADIYRKFGLVDDEGVYSPKRAIWSFSADKQIGITLRDLDKVAD